MAGSDVVQAMRLALKPFNIQHLADDWAAQAAGKMLITNMSTLGPDPKRNVDHPDLLGISGSS